MNGKIYYPDGTVKVITDTRTPEEKEAAQVAIRQRMEEYYNRPENAERKRERDGRRAEMKAMMQKWDEQDRAAAERKKESAIRAAEYRAERDARDRKFLLKHLCLLPFYIVGLPFILMYIFIKSCVKNGTAKTLNDIGDGVAGFFKALPYIIFPPLIFLEILEGL